MCTRSFGNLTLSAWSMLLLLLVFTAHARADDTASSDLHYYAEAEPSAMIIEIPRYQPLWLRTNALNGPAERLSSSMTDSSIAAPSLQAVVGANGADGWLFEMQVGYAKAETSHAETYLTTAPYTHIGYFPINGQGNAAGANNGMHTFLEYELEQMDVALLAGKTFEQGNASITPFAGYWFMHLAQKYRLNHIGIVSAPGFIVLYDETATADYNGLLVGVRVERNVGGWDFEVESTHGLALILTQYEGSQNYWGGTSLYTLSTDGLEPGYRGTLKVSAARQWGDHWKFGLTLDARYLSYVPGIVSSGMDNAEHYADPSHLEGYSSLSGRLGLNLSYSF